MSWVMKIQAALLIWACASSAASPVSDEEMTAPAVVSTSLCADTYVLALVEPEAIRALSWQVDHPVSAAPDWARTSPQAWSSAEVLLGFDDAVIVFGAGEAGRAGALLSRAGRSSAELGWASDFAGVAENLAELGQALDREVQAGRLVGEMEARLARLEARGAERTATPGIVYLSSSGGSAGAGTYIDAAIRAAGGRNLTAEAGGQGWTRSDPEFALGLSPDLLITSFFTDGYRGRLSRATHHAAYAPLLATSGRIDIPSGDWPCAGPRLIDAAEQIADAIDAWEARQ